MHIAKIENEFYFSLNNLESCFLLSLKDKAKKLSEENCLNFPLLLNEKFISGKDLRFLLTQCNFRQKKDQETIKNVVFPQIQQWLDGYDEQEKIFSLYNIKSCNVLKTVKASYHDNSVDVKIIFTTDNEFYFSVSNIKKLFSVSFYDYSDYFTLFFIDNRKTIFISKEKIMKFLNRLCYKGMLNFFENWLKNTVYPAFDKEIKRIIVKENLIQNSNNYTLDEKTKLLLDICNAKDELSIALAVSKYMQKLEEEKNVY